MAVKASGFVESVRGGVVSGWASGGDQIVGPLELSVSVDGAMVMTITANLPRSDVAQATGRHPDCGFMASLPPVFADAQAHQLSVTAVANNMLLKGAPLAFTWKPDTKKKSAPAAKVEKPAAIAKAPSKPASVQPSADAVSAPAETMRGFLNPVAKGQISGWAENLLNPAEKLKIDIRIDNALVTTLVADQEVPSLRKQGGKDVHLGFTMEIPEKFKDGIQHKVSAYFHGTKQALKKSPCNFVFSSVKPAAQAGETKVAPAPSAKTVPVAASQTTPPASLKPVRLSPPATASDLPQGNPWHPSPVVRKAVLDRFAGRAPAGLGAGAAEVLALYPFLDIQGALAIADSSHGRGIAIPAPPHARLSLDVGNGDLDGLVASLCSWAVISDQTPDLYADSPERLAAAQSHLRSVFGDWPVKAARKGEKAIEIDAVAGEVFHPSLLRTLEELPQAIQAISWDMLLIEGKVGVGGAVVRVRPSAPIPGVGRDVGALRASQARLPRASKSDIVAAPLSLPVCLSARFGLADYGKTRYSLPDVRPVATSIVIVGDDPSALIQSIQSVALQRTDAPLELLIVDIPGGGLAENKALQAAVAKLPANVGRFVSCGHDAGRAQRWNTGIAQCRHDRLVLLSGGVTLRDPDTVQQVVAWSLLPGTALVSTDLVLPPSPNLKPKYPAIADLVPRGKWVNTNVTSDFIRSLPALIAHEPMGCWAVDRTVWERLGGFSIEPGFAESFDLEFALRARRLGLHMLRSGCGAVAYAHGELPAGPRIDAVISALYPELAALEQARPGIVDVGLYNQVQFDEGRLTYKMPSPVMNEEGPQFAARELFNQRRHVMQSRVKITEKMVEARRLLSSLATEMEQAAALVEEF